MASMSSVITATRYILEQSPRSYRGQNEDIIPSNAADLITPDNYRTPSFDAIDRMVSQFSVKAPELCGGEALITPHALPQVVGVKRTRNNNVAERSAKKPRKSSAVVPPSRRKALITSKEEAHNLLAGPLDRTPDNISSPLDRLSPKVSISPLKSKPAPAKQLNGISSATAKKSRTVRDRDRDAPGPGPSPLRSAPLPRTQKTENNASASKANGTRTRDKVRDKERDDASPYNRTPRKELSPKKKSRARAESPEYMFTNNTTPRRRSKPERTEAKESRKERANGRTPEREKDSRPSRDTNGVSRPSARRKEKVGGATKESYDSDSSIGDTRRKTEIKESRRKSTKNDDDSRRRRSTKTEDGEKRRSSIKESRKKSDGDGTTERRRRSGRGEDGERLRGKSSRNERDEREHERAHRDEREERRAIESGRRKEVPDDSSRERGSRYQTSRRRRSASPEATAKHDGHTGADKRNRERESTEASDRENRRGGRSDRTREDKYSARDRLRAPKPKTKDEDKMEVDSGKPEAANGRKESRKTKNNNNKNRPTFVSQPAAVAAPVSVPLSKPAPPPPLRSVTIPTSKPSNSAGAVPTPTPRFVSKPIPNGITAPGPSARISPTRPNANTRSPSEHRNGSNSNNNSISRHVKSSEEKKADYERTNEMAVALLKENKFEEYTACAVEATKKAFVWALSKEREVRLNEKEMRKSDSRRAAETGNVWRAYTKVKNMIKEHQKNLTENTNNSKKVGDTKNILADDNNTVAVTLQRILNKCYLRMSMLSALWHNNNDKLLISMQDAVARVVKANHEERGQIDKVKQKHPEISGALLSDNETACLKKFLREYRNSIQTFNNVVSNLGSGVQEPGSECTMQ